MLHIIVTAIVVLLAYDNGCCSFDNSQRLHGMIYMTRITDRRFEESMARRLTRFNKLIGTDSHENTVLLTTMWDEGTTRDQIQQFEDTEQELKTHSWVELIRSGAMCERSFNKKAVCHEIISRIVQRVVNSSRNSQPV